MRRKPLETGINESFISNTVRPQDDLYRYANGEWLKNYKIPDDASWGGVIRDLMVDNRNRLRVILDKASSKPENQAEQQIGDFYSSFMNVDLLEELGSATIAYELRRIEQLTTIDQATKLMGEFLNIGVQGLFDFSVGINVNNKKNIAYMFAGGNTLECKEAYTERDYYASRQLYIKYFTDYLTLIGTSRSKALKQAKQNLAFEKSLSKFHQNNIDSQNEDKINNFFTFEDLQKLTKTFNFTIWAKSAGINLHKLSEVVINNPSFFRNLHKVYNQKNLPIIKIWLTINVIRTFSKFLSPEFIEVEFRLTRKNEGVKTKLERWQEGVSLFQGDEMLCDLMGEIYIKQFFTKTTKNTVSSITKNILESCRMSIEETDWMDNQTKIKAIKKLENIYLHIGYPKKWVDYSNLVIKKDDLVGNYKRIAEFEHKKQVSSIGKNFDMNVSDSPCYEINAYNSLNQNKLSILAGIIQEPIFSTNYDPAVNYGAFGATIIGHEIGHAFDSEGSKYDENGHLSSWWNQSDKKEFTKRANKLVKQFNELSPKQLDDSFKVNGKLTLQENMSDLTGLSIAYKAYKKHLNGKVAPTINGLTGDQRFFVAYAQAHRIKLRKQLLIQDLDTDSHAPDEFRVNQIVRNFDEFYEAFNIQPTDKLWLNPKDRVKIL